MAPSTQRLVGQRVEEGARAGRALAAGDVAVEPVAGGDQEAHDDVEPRGAPDHDHEHEDRGGQQAADRHRVGRGGQRRRPEGEVRLRCRVVRGLAHGAAAPAGTGSRSATRTANRSGPSAPVIVTSTSCRPPGRRAGARCRRSRAPRGRCGPRRARRPAPGRVRPTSGVARGGRDRVLQLGALAQALEPRGRPGTWSGRSAAWVPSSREKGKKPAQSSWAAARNSSSRSWSRSVSPG